MQSQSAGVAADTRPAHKRIIPRPQRIHTWFNLIPVQEFEDTRPERIAFLDSFVTVERGTEPDDYAVLFEGERRMTVVVEIGVIFVWYGEDLAKPDRPFPVFFEKKFDSSFVSSSKSEFVDTHIMDFVENGSDNLHFQAVHLWEYSKIFNHKCNEDTITLQQHTRFRYGLCSAKRLVRWFARLAPKLELEHDYVYHGPGLAVVGNKGAMVPDTQVLVSLTPQGENGTRVYVTIAAHPDTFKPWQEWIYGRLTGGKRLCNWLAGVMCNYTKNEFDVDKIIWENKKYIRDAGLLPGERELRGVMSWGEKFYPKDFRRPELPEKTAEEREWRFLDDAKNIRRGKVHSYSIDGEELIARRDEAGDLRVFDAFCPHQGAHLGRGGRLTGDGCLRCPFHAFSFDAAGGCHGQNGTLQSRRIPTLNLSHRQHRITEGKVEVLV